MPLGGTLYTGEDQWNELVGVAQAPVAVQTTQPAPAPAAAAPPPVTDSQGYAAEQPYAPVEGGVNYGSQAQPATLPAAQPVAESYYVEPTSDAAQGYAPAGVMEVGMVADKYFAGYPTPTKSAQYGQYSGGTHVGVPGAAAEPRIEGPGNNFDLAETVIQPAAEAAFGTPATYQGIPNYQEPYNPNASMYYGGQSTERATPVIHPDRFGASGYADYGTGANAAQTAGSPYTSSGSAMYGQGAVDAYNGGYPVTAGTQSMGYDPAAVAAYEEPNRQAEWEAVARGAQAQEPPIMDVIGPDLQRGWDTISGLTLTQPDQAAGDRSAEWASRDVYPSDRTAEWASRAGQPTTGPLNINIDPGTLNADGLNNIINAAGQAGQGLLDWNEDVVADVRPPSSPAVEAGTLNLDALMNLGEAARAGGQEIIGRNRGIVEGVRAPGAEVLPPSKPTAAPTATAADAKDYFSDARDKELADLLATATKDRDVRPVTYMDANGDIKERAEDTGINVSAGSPIGTVYRIDVGEDGKAQAKSALTDDGNFKSASDVVNNGMVGVAPLAANEADALVEAGYMSEALAAKMTGKNLLVPYEWSDTIANAAQPERDTHLGATDGTGKGTAGTGVDTNVGATATATSSGTSGGGRSDGGTYRGGYSGGGGRGYGGGGGGGYYDDGGGGGSNPFDNPIFDRFLETVGRSNPEWLSSMMEMFSGRGGGFSGMGRGSSSRMSRRGSKSRSRSRMGRKGSPSKTSTSSSGSETFPARKRSRATANGKTVTSN